MSTRKTSRLEPPPTPKRTNPLGVLVFVAWLVLGLYVGLAGWTKVDMDILKEQAKAVKCDPNDPNSGFNYNGESFCSLEDILVAQQQEEMEKTYLAWVFSLPSPLPTVVTAFAFGALGSCITILRVGMAHKELPELYEIAASPLLGGLTALMLLGVSYLLPSALTIEGKIILRPTTQLFVSLFAGAYYEHIHKWLRSSIEKIFKLEKEAEK